MGPPRELDEIAELEFDFIEELMAEPPHGHNHGRKRGAEGSWTPLETDPGDTPSFKRYPMAHELPPDERHGVSAYQNRKCRCQVCRKAWADYKRLRRRDHNQREAEEVRTDAH